MHAFIDCPIRTASSKSQFSSLYLKVMPLPSSRTEELRTEEGAGEGSSCIASVTRKMKTFHIIYGGLSISARRNFDLDWLLSVSTPVASSF